MSLEERQLADMEEKNYLKYESIKKSHHSQIGSVFIRKSLQSLNERFATSRYSLQYPNHRSSDDYGTEKLDESSSWGMSYVPTPAASRKNSLNPSGRRKSSIIFAAQSQTSSRNETVSLDTALSYITTSQETALKAPTVRPVSVNINTVYQTFKRASNGLSSPDKATPIQSVSNGSKTIIDMDLHFEGGPSELITDPKTRKSVKDKLSTPSSPTSSGLGSSFSSFFPTTPRNIKNSNGATIAVKLSTEPDSIPPPSLAQGDLIPPPRPDTTSPQTHRLPSSTTQTIVESKSKSKTQTSVPSSPVKKIRRRSSYDLSRASSILGMVKALFSSKPTIDQDNLDQTSLKVPDETPSNSSKSEQDMIQLNTTISVLESDEEIGNSDKNGPIITSFPRRGSRPELDRILTQEHFNPASNSIETMNSSDTASNFKSVNEYRNSTGDDSSTNNRNSSKDKSPERVLPLRSGSSKNNSSPSKSRATAIREVMSAGGENRYIRSSLHMRPGGPSQAVEKLASSVHQLREMENLLQTVEHIKSQKKNKFEQQRHDEDNVSSSIPSLLHSSTGKSQNTQLVDKFMQTVEHIKGTETPIINSMNRRVVPVPINEMDLDMLPQYKITKSDNGRRNSSPSPPKVNSRRGSENIHGSRQAFERVQQSVEQLKEIERIAKKVVRITQEQKRERVESIHSQNGLLYNNETPNESKTRKQKDIEDLAKTAQWLKYSRNEHTIIPVNSIGQSAPLTHESMSPETISLSQADRQREISLMLKTMKMLQSDGSIALHVPRAGQAERSGHSSPRGPHGALPPSPRGAP
jgi:hypothetical protein